MSDAKPGLLARFWPFLVFLALASLLAVGVKMSGRENREAIPSPLIGRPAPSFELYSLHEPERLVAVEELRGAPFLLNVWGSWCPACRDEHPYIEQIARTGKLRVVGLNWNDERADALRWLQQFGDPYALIVVDEGSQTAIDWGVVAAPETFLVDAEGIVRWKHTGPLFPRHIENDLKPILRTLGVEL